MSLYGKHIKLQGIRNESSFYRGIFLLCMLVLCFRPDTSFSQVISNTGAHITLTSGVFVDTRDVENTSGVVTNNGRFDLDGSYINAGTTGGNGEYSLTGNWTNTGTFNAGTSTVTFEGTQNQSISKPAGETFHNLVVTNTGAAPNNQVNLVDDANVNGIFTFTSGNVNSGSSKLYLTNPALAALDYTSVSESRVIGKFERGVNTASTYLFPLGSLDFYNPLTLSPNAIPSPGSVLSEFFPVAPGDNGLPIPDVLVEVWETYPDGYWGLTANNGFSASDFDLTADGNGFEEAINFYNRLIKRPAMGLWTTDGDHRDATGTVAARDNLTNNISPGGSQFAIAKIRPRIIEQPEDTAICEEADGGFRVVATGYTPLSYQWQLRDLNGNWNPVTDDLIYEGSLNDTILLNGVPIAFDDNRYRVVITDDYSNFKESDSAKLTVDPIPDITNNILGDTICNNTGINIPLFSDVPGTSYEWDIYPDAHITGGFPDSQLSITQGLANSDTLIENIVYRVFPTGPGTTQCKGSSVDFTILVTPTMISSEVPKQYIGGNNIRCFGENNGEINITPKGGFYLDTYAYSWKRNGQSFGDPTVQDRNSLASGFYEYRVEDIIGCFVERSLTLTEPDFLLARPDSIGFVSCEGTRDGTIHITPNGGIEPYSYKWVDVDNKITTSEDLDSARYGFHDFTVTDVNGCKFFQEEVNIGSLNPMTIGLSPKTFGNFNVSCFGKSDGEIVTSVIDGNGDPDLFNYTWYDENDVKVSIEKDPIDLSAGYYTVYIVDEVGCRGSNEQTLKQPQPISIVKTNGKKPGNYDISCNDLSDGSIILSTAGGHTGYRPSSHSWSMTGNPTFDDTTKNINGLRAGTYVIDVTDIYGCQNNASFTLTEPTKIVLDTALISDFNGYQVSCINSTNSFIKPEITGGHGDYTYLWSTPDGALSDPLSGDQSGLPAGNYRLDLLDSINCPAQWDFVITEPDSIAVAPVLHMNNGFEVSCYEGSDGAITLNTAGGVSPYAFAWTSIDGSGLETAEENQSGLSKGSYSVSVTDDNNCEAVWDFPLNQPEKLISNIDTTTISCFSSNDGMADLSVSGGVGPYSYLWSTGDTLQDIASLFVGGYFVRVVDANSCVIEDTAVVTEPPEILIDLSVPLQYNGRMISCFGASDAIVNSLVTGGKMEGDYQYEWLPNNEQSTSISNVPAGLYYLSVRDINNCVKVDSIQVVQPPKLITEVYETNPTCFGKSDGDITLIVQGGTPGTSGYSIVWSDGQLGQTAAAIGNGTYDVAIWDLNNCRIDTFGTLLQPELLHLSKEVAQPTCPDIPDGAIEYRIDGGTAPYDMRLNSLQVDELVTDLGDGVYHLVITDNNQCSLYDTTTLKGVSPMCIRVPNAITPNGDGVNDTWVIDQIEIYPSVKVEIYNRWGELIFYAPRGYSQPWDGTFKGRQLPIDSYYYVIDLNNGRDVVTGNITIIR